MSFDDLVLVLFTSDMRDFAQVSRSGLIGRQAAMTEQHDSTVLHTPKPKPSKIQRPICPENCVCVDSSWITNVDVSIAGFMGNSSPNHVGGLL